MPICHLQPLIEHMPGIEASELQAWLPVMTFTWMEKHSQRKFTRQLNARTRALHPPVEQEPMEVIEHNPEKAAEWFRQQGMHVVNA